MKGSWEETIDHLQWATRMAHCNHEGRNGGSFPFVLSCRAGSKKRNRGSTLLCVWMYAYPQLVGPQCLIAGHERAGRARHTARRVTLPGRTAVRGRAFGCAVIPQRTRAEETRTGPKDRRSVAQALRSTIEGARQPQARENRGFPRATALRVGRESSMSPLFLLLDS